jgi:Tol biopolymer transport system component
VKRALGVVLLFAAVSATASARGASTPPRIVFSADQRAAVSFEVYRVTLAGKRIGLSKSPFEDSDPHVSPNGRWVAFLSSRNGGRTVWVVHPDGTGLRRISRVLPTPDGGSVELAWSPRSDRLAVSVAKNIGSGGSVLLVGPGLKQRTIARGAPFYAPGWSPDGALVTVSDRETVRALTPTGRRAWLVPAANTPIGWSKQGAFAPAPLGGKIPVVDIRGRVIFTVRADLAAWSPTGAYLATARGGRLDVLTPGGRVVRTVTGLGGTSDLTWQTPSRVSVATADDRQKTVDVRTGNVVTGSAAYIRTRAFSDDGRLVATAEKTGSGFGITVGRVDGGARRTVTSVPGCTDDGGPQPAVLDLQFTPDARSLVYESYCVEPFANLYAIAPDGTGLRRLTNVQQQQTDPALSPDGTSLVYSAAPATGLSCKGCPQNLVLATADGTTIRQLTTQDYGNFNTGATWSPDGGSILYSHGTPNEIGLFVVPPGGGAPRDLHVSAQFAAWGPSLIAYTAWTGSQGLWTAKPDGTDKVKVASGDLYAPAWSANGRLAWLSTPGEGGASSLHVQGLPARVLSSFTAVAKIAWAPDGTGFAAVARAKGTAVPDVYTFDLNGGNVKRLTRDIGALGVTYR